MIKKEDMVFDLIKDGKCVSEIKRLTNTNTTNLSMILYNLRQKYNMVSSINDLGELRFLIDSDIDEMNMASIDLSYPNLFRAMVISDTHFGNEYARPDYLTLIYNYCKKNDIHIIIHAGDFIDGTSSAFKQYIKNPTLQVSKAISNYPYDDNILNLVCFGNHDFSAFENGVNIKDKILCQRYDIRPFALGCGIINIGNDIFYVKHPIDGFKYENVNNHFILSGHSHKIRIFCDKVYTNVKIPTLSDLRFNENQSLPGALEMKVLLNYSHIIGVEFRHLSILSEGSNLNKCGLFEVGKYDYRFNYEKSPINDETYMPEISDDKKRELVKKYGYMK